MFKNICLLFWVIISVKSYGGLINTYQGKIFDSSNGGLQGCENHLVAMEKNLAKYSKDDFHLIALRCNKIGENKFRIVMDYETKGYNGIISYGIDSIVNNHCESTLQKFNSAFASKGTVLVDSYCSKIVSMIDKTKITWRLNIDYISNILSGIKIESFQDSIIHDNTPACEGRANDISEQLSGKNLQGILTCIKSTNGSLKQDLSQVKGFYLYDGKNFVTVKFLRNFESKQACIDENIQITKAFENNAMAVINTTCNKANIRDLHASYITFLTQRSIRIEEHETSNFYDLNSCEEYRSVFVNRLTLNNYKVLYSFCNKGTDSFTMKVTYLK